ncbi:PHB depolymerase esterase [Stenotrophomonas sp. ESTM1D_MKCIP4_1]|uniref:extracellular catalytic domain type 1 short-chain-length polyhydroxyalkanoate depolymerase n=1 Tax=Stenotrophomonas sp. ESTM1D_MKCIP4_1 TaxID=2072414 RepID=UPI000D53CC03|nr:PHB depolymerase family esterase [Stenotrophomonas sp. ESTM1D_MKCIP4_1]AWH53533.1 PHB depolymerase esterase [Stenotrophomonas sp. ESTM1D_MKCIP4_1]
MNAAITSIRTLLLGLCTWLAMSATAAAADTPGHWDFGVYGNVYGAREYQVWVPANYQPSQPLPLLLVLHGCVTGPNLMGEASGFNDVADTEGFIVVYPRQNVTANPMRCWNFPLPVNQARGSGEPSILAGIVDEVKAGYAVDPRRVYVTGISAGGAMTATMLACYSDVFAAGAIHAGGMYKGATTVSGSAYALLAGSIYSPDSNGRLAWQCSGSPKPRPLPVLVFHGSADSTVNPINGQQAVRQFLQTNDLADDGLDNDSVKYVPTSTYQGQVPGGRSYTVDTYAYNGRVLAQHYVVQGMGHAWSGSQTGLPFTDAQGPDATLITWLFLKDNQR